MGGHAPAREYPHAGAPHKDALVRTGGALRMHAKNAGRCKKKGCRLGTPSLFMRAMPLGRRVLAVAGYSLAASMAFSTFAETALVPPKM